MTITVLELYDAPNPGEVNPCRFDLRLIVEQYFSVLWNDRYYECGDFELVIPATDENVLELKEDRILLSNESEYAMIIEKVELKTDAEEGDQLIVTGRSAESLLDRRIVWNETYFYGRLETLYPDPINDPSMVVNAIRKLVTDNFGRHYEVGDYRAMDEILGVDVEGELTQDHPFLSMFVTAFVYGKTVLEVIIDICQQLGIGFKLIPIINDANWTIKFKLYLYYGLNLTDDPEQNPNEKVVIFSEDFDNILNSDYFIDKQAYKNVIKVDGTWHEIQQDEEGKDVEVEVPVSVTVEGKIKLPDQTEIIPSGRLRREEYNDSTSVSDKGLYTAELYDVASTITAYIANNSLLASKVPTEDSFLEFMWVNSSDPKWRMRVNGVGNYEDVTLSDYGLYAVSSDPYFPTFKVKVRLSNLDGSEKTISQSEYETRLDNEGKGVLIEKEYVEEFTGEVLPDVSWQYGTKDTDDYYLGDIVTVRNRYGMAAYCRITEYLRSEDASGITRIPTFALESSNFDSNT